MAAPVGLNNVDIQFLQSLGDGERKALYEDMEDLEGKMGRLNVKFQKEAKIEGLRKNVTKLKKEVEIDKAQLAENNAKKEKLDARLAALLAEKARRAEAKNAMAS